MLLKYAILLKVEMLHDYYNDLRCPDLDFVPSRDTADALKGHDMLYKSIGNKLILLIKTDDTGKPIIVPNSSLKLCFYVNINNVRFANYTNINFHPFDATRFYFTNLNQTKVGTSLYLNTAVAQYNSANNYPVGALAGDAMGNHYEAIKSSSSSNIHDTSNPGYWQPKGTAQYVNNGDGISLAGDTYLFHGTANTDFTIHIYTLNTATSAYDNLLTTSTIHYPTAQPTVPVDLSLLKNGKYRIEVNGSSILVYHDKEAILQNCFGMVELFNNLPAANDFSWFDATGLPKQSTYSIRFANRSAIWKYIARSGDVTAIKDNASVYTFNNVPASTVFTSSVPIPFKEQPLNSLFLESASLGNISPIPNPPTDRLSTIIQGSDHYYCSEKHLNY